MNNLQTGRSDFDGGLLGLIGTSLLAGLITAITFGIAYPWAYCMLIRWRVNHTIIDGHRLRFDGTGGSLIGQWIKMLFFMLITLGIYGFWVGIALEKWAAERTHFE